MSDDDFDMERFKGLALVVVLFIGLLVYCAFDLLFLCFSRNAVGAVSSVEIDRGRRGREYVMIEWTFAGDDDKTRKGYANLGSPSLNQPLVGDSIAVQYLPTWLLSDLDRSSCRIKKSFGWISLGLLFFSMIGVAYFTYAAIYILPEKPAGIGKRTR